jgi:hypothetical protein
MYRGSRHLGKINRSIPAHSSSNFRRWSAERVGRRSKAGGTISQQAAVHSWLATNAQQQQQQDKTRLIAQVIVKYLFQWRANSKCVIYFHFGFRHVDTTQI